MRAPARPARSAAAAEPVSAARARPRAAARTSSLARRRARRARAGRRRSGRAPCPAPRRAPARRRRAPARETTIATPSSTSRALSTRVEARYARCTRLIVVLGQAPSARPSTPRDESMITRQGRSASTVSSVLPEQRPARPPRRQRHHDRARRRSRAPPPRSGAPPGPGAPSPSARSRAARRARARSRSARPRAPPPRASRRRSASSRGTVIVTSTWMPRRRRAARLRRGGHRLGRVAAVLEGHQHRLVLHLVLDDRLGHHDLVRLGQREALAAPVDARSSAIPSASQTTPETSTRRSSTVATTNAMPVPRPPKIASSGSVAPARCVMLPGLAPGPLDVGLLDPQRDQRRVRDRERQHRPERVDHAEELGLAGHDRQAGDGAEDR